MTWKLAFRNLLRNKRRTLATGAAVLAGFVGLSLLGGYILRIEKSLKSNSVYLQHKGHVTIYKKEGLQRYATRPSKFLITFQDYEVLQNQLKVYAKDIEWTGQTLTGAGLVSNGEKSVPFMAYGVDLQTLEKSYRHPQVLKWAQDFLVPESLKFVDAIKKDPLSISVTKRLGALIRRQAPFESLAEEQRFVQLAGMSIYGDLNAVDATLAVNHTTGSELAEDAGLLAPLELLQSLYMADGFHYIMVYLHDDSNKNKLVQGLNDLFKKNNLQFEAYPFDDPAISPNYVGSMGFLYAMVGFFVFLICGAVALSIVNSLTMGILERTREIGTFRAIGYTNTQISWMMTQEALALALVSGIVGTVISGIVSLIVNQLNIRFSPPGVSTSIQFVLSPHFMLIFMVFMLFFILIGTTSYIVTHWKLKMKIIDLLSDTGA